MSLARAFALTLALTGAAAMAAPSTAELIGQGDKLWGEGQTAKAQQAFEAAAGAEPRSVPVLLRLAGFQLANRQLDASVATYQRAIGLDPKNAKPWLGLSLAYLHAGKRDLAQTALDEVLRLDPQKREQLAPLQASLAAH